MAGSGVVPSRRPSGKCKSVVAPINSRPTRSTYSHAGTDSPHTSQKADTPARPYPATPPPPPPASHRSQRHHRSNGQTERERPFNRQKNRPRLGRRLTLIYIGVRYRLGVATNGSILCCIGDIRGVEEKRHNCPHHQYTVRTYNDRVTTKAYWGGTPCP